MSGNGFVYLGMGIGIDVLNSHFLGMGMKTLIPDIWGSNWKWESQTTFSLLGMGMAMQNGVPKSTSTGTLSIWS